LANHGPIRPRLRLDLVLALDPATVQAWSAVAVAVLTAVLVVATVLYVRRTGAMAREMRRTNDAAARNTELTLRMQAANLEVLQGASYRPQILDDNDQPQDGTTWIFEYVVKNVGVGTAYSLALETDKGYIQADGAMRPTEKEHLSLAVPADDVGAAPDRPALKSLVFEDAGGTWWVQQVRSGILGRPEMMED
jgi:hypothetical protein